MTPGCICSIVKRQPAQSEHGSWYCKTCGYWLFGDWQKEQEEFEKRQADVTQTSRLMARLNRDKHRRVAR